MATLNQQLVAARQENTELRALLARADADTAKCEAKYKDVLALWVKFDAQLVERTRELRAARKQRDEYKCAYEAMRRQQRLAFCRTNNVSAGDAREH